LVLISNKIAYIFRHQNGSQADPTSLKIVDLQGTKLGRPAIELVYFFFSSTTPSQRQQHLEGLILFYWDRFNEELKGLGSNFGVPFSLEELKQEFDSCRKFAFVRFPMGCAQAQVVLYL